jgi:hypothetical protein
MKRLMISLLLSPTVALAHHGVAGVGAGARGGAGAPGGGGG